MKNYPSAIAWADHSLRKDPHILYQVALKCHRALQYADRNFMLSILQDAMTKKAEGERRNKRKRGSENTCVGDDSIDEGHRNCRCGGRRKLYSSCEKCGHYNHVRKTECAFCCKESDFGLRRHDYCDDVVVEVQI